MPQGFDSLPQQSSSGDGGGAGGVSGDYGYVRYGQMMGADAMTMAANTPTQFVVAEPRQITDNLKAPFAGFSFFDDDGLLRCRAVGDSYELTVRMLVVPQVTGGWIELDLNVAGNVSGLSGPVASRRRTLNGPAQTNFRFDEVFTTFPSTGWLANGAQLVLTASVQITVSAEVLFIVPRVAAA